MKHSLRSFFILLAVVSFVRLGNGCGPFFDEDVFQQSTDPDAPYAKYVAGRIGLLQSTYRIRHLVVAYNTLSGRGLTPGEQRAAVAVDMHFNTDNYTPAMIASFNANPQSSAAAGGGRAPEGTTTPTPRKCRSGFSVFPISQAAIERHVPGQDYESFSNCLVDAFANATATLTDRRARYGKPGQPDTPEIADWIAGQQAVFSNCSGAGQTPQPAPANAPPWLRQDRAYQTAAAAFYALDFDTRLPTSAPSPPITPRRGPRSPAISSPAPSSARPPSPMSPASPYPANATSNIAAEKRRHARKDSARRARSSKASFADPAMKPLHEPAAICSTSSWPASIPPPRPAILARRLDAAKRPAAIPITAERHRPELHLQLLPTYSPWLP